MRRYTPARPDEAWRRIAECSAAGFSHGTPLAKLAADSAFVTLNLNEGGKPPRPAEAWLRVAECSTDLLSADAGADVGAAPGGVCHAVTPSRRTATLPIFVPESTRVVPS